MSHQLKDKKALFLNTNFLVVLTVCLVYSIQVSSLSLLIGQIFKKSN